MHKSNIIIYQSIVSHKLHNLKSFLIVKNWTYIIFISITWNTNSPLIAIIMPSRRLLLFVRSMTGTSRSRSMPPRSTSRSFPSMGPFSIAVSRFFGATAWFSFSIAISVSVSAFSMRRVSSAGWSHVRYYWRCHRRWRAHRRRSC